MFWSKEERQLMHAILEFAINHRTSFFSDIAVKHFNYKHSRPQIEKLLKRLVDDGTLEVSKLYGGDGFQITHRGNEIWRLTYYLNPDQYPELHSDYYLSQQRLDALAKDSPGPIELPLLDHPTPFTSKPPVNINDLISSYKKTSLKSSNISSASKQNSATPIIEKAESKDAGVRYWTKGKVIYLMEAIGLGVFIAFLIWLLKLN